MNAFATGATVPEVHCLALQIACNASMAICSSPLRNCYSSPVKAILQAHHGSIKALQSNAMLAERAACKHTVRSSLSAQQKHKVCVETMIVALCSPQATCSASLQCTTSRYTLLRTIRYFAKLRLHFFTSTTSLQDIFLTLDTTCCKRVSLPSKSGQKGILQEPVVCKHVLVSFPSNSDFV